MLTADRQLPVAGESSLLKKEVGACTVIIVDMVQGRRYIMLGMQGNSCKCIFHKFAHIHSMHYPHQ